MVSVYNFSQELQKVRCDCIVMHTKLLHEQDSNVTNELGSVKQCYSISSQLSVSLSGLSCGLWDSVAVILLQTVMVCILYLPTLTPAG